MTHVLPITPFGGHLGVVYKWYHAILDIFTRSPMVMFFITKALVQLSQNSWPPSP